LSDQFKNSSLSKKIFFEEDQLNLFNSIVNTPITLNEVQKIEDKKNELNNNIKQIREVLDNKLVKDESYMTNLKKIEDLENTIDHLDRIDNEKDDEEGNKYKNLEKSLDSLLNSNERNEYETDVKLVKNLKIDDKLIDELLNILEKIKTKKRI